MFWLRAQARLHTWKRHIPGRVMEVLRRVEPARLPLRLSSQEQRLKQAFEHGKLTVLTGPRGCRKSFTALRLSHRSYIFSDFTYIDEKTWAKLEKENVDPLESVLKKSFGQLLWDLLAPALLAGAVCVVKETFAQEGTDEGAKAEDPQHKDASHQSFEQNLMLRVQANIPSEETVWYGLLAFVATFLVRGARKRFFIFDDITVDAWRHTAHKTNVSVTSAKLGLESLRSFGEKHSAILISSNEGLGRCFMDTAALKYRTAEMILATPIQLVHAMSRWKLLRSEDETPRTGIDALLSLLEKEFKWDANKLFQQKLDPLLPARWAYSMRFWSQIAEDDAEQLFAKDAVVDFNLFVKIAQELDLQASGIFRIAALALSKPCSDEDRTKLLKLAFSDPDAHQAAIPEAVPFRLCVAYLLVYQMEQQMVALHDRTVQTSLEMLGARLKLPAERDLLDDELKIMWKINMKKLSERVENLRMP